MERIWSQLKDQTVERLGRRGLHDSPHWPVFSRRLDDEFVRLAELLFPLYGARPDFAYQLEEILVSAFAAHAARPGWLTARDAERGPESRWILSEHEVGAVAYVDLFGGNFAGVGKRIPYLKELGVTYLHLMPFFRCPEKENDGGYAVSSYRETDARLGTMDDLADLAEKLEEAGIALVADFVFNHTSDGHDWARRAADGDPEYQDFYFFFSDSGEMTRYAPYLRDIFPEVRRGSFTYLEHLKKWVWTSFHSYQWDLNYRNPAVFRSMAEEMLSIANRGVSVLRLDAVAFIWKEAGTSCENLEQAHTLIRAFQSVVRIAAPSLLFKSEAIVHPDEIIRYVDSRECRLSYNPLLMAELWEAAATREVKLLSHSIRKRHRLPAGCAWANYVRCHDDIGWTFADEDAAEVGIRGSDHREFLNRFYTGEFPGSFSRGLRFQYNPDTGDMRICGTAASLAGVERAREESLGEDGETALRRLLLLYGVAFSAGGIPLIYLGDELAVENDYSFRTDPSRSYDSRWVHRPVWNEERAKKRKNLSSTAGRVFSAMAAFSRIRKSHPVFGSPDLTVLDSRHPSVLAFLKREGGSALLVLGNFSEHAAIVPADAGFLAGGKAKDLISGRVFLPNADIVLEPCELLWLLPE
jgi:amylosucrase